MATSRPLMRLGIGDLEEIFANERESAVALSRLKHELSHRQAPKAIALLQRIGAAEALLKDLDVVDISANSNRTVLPVEQHDSSPRIPDDLLCAIDEEAASQGASQLGGSPQLKAIQAPMKWAHATEAPIPQLALDDAYRALKVGVGESWERIESARRKIVLKSSPDATKGLPAANLQQLLSDAKLANDAALVIALRRCGRQ